MIWTRNYSLVEILKFLINVFWSDDPIETEKFLQMGADTVLANDYLSIANTVKKWKENH